jgi:hypothetical protein
MVPMPGQVVIKKLSPSTFFGTPLMSYLIEHSIDTLIVVGESTSVCVRTTVVDGAHAPVQDGGGGGGRVRLGRGRARDEPLRHACEFGEDLPVKDVLAWMAA